jgi:transcriptional regulator with XRE-family HTH domain
MKLDELIKRARADRAMSLQQTAVRGHISRQTVFEIEHDMSWNLTVNTVYGLSEALGLDPNAILDAAIESMEEARG